MKMETDSRLDHRPVPFEMLATVVQRFRNFPSLALFYDGSKKETWKADMDGALDIDNKDIKSAIDDVLAEDVF